MKGRILTVASGVPDAPASQLAGASLERPSAAGAPVTPFVPRVLRKKKHTPKSKAPPKVSWWCDPCHANKVTKIINGVPVCSSCKTPIERHLPEGYQ